jgi:hypothetical protein
LTGQQNKEARAYRKSGSFLFSMKLILLLEDSNVGREQKSHSFS